MADVNLRLNRALSNLFTSAIRLRDLAILTKSVISLIQDVGTQMGMDSATWNGLAVKK